MKFVWLILFSTNHRRNIKTEVKTFLSLIHGHSVLLHTIKVRYSLRDNAS